MIPQSFLQDWSTKAPWPDFRQIEQDLIISRALCDLFNSPALRGTIAFRGGTAINKLLFRRPLRYSEDIDLVQTQPGPIGNTVDAIREALGWLGDVNRSQAGHSMHLVFRFVPEADPQSTLRLKVEINTREHQSRYGIREYPFSVENDWYQGQCSIASYDPEELFGTKLRALLQRQKNRDLFDLAHGLDQLEMDLDKVLDAFNHYLELAGTPITRAHAEERMLGKLRRNLTEDIAPLLPAGIRFEESDALRAFDRVWAELVSKLDGDPWRSAPRVIAELRQRHYPTLLAGIV